MTYDAEGVIKRKREDGRQERSEEKEEPRTRKSRGEETTTIQEPEEERENTGAGEQSTKREPTFTQELKGEEDTASNLICYLQIVLIHVGTIIQAVMLCPDAYPDCYVL
ncbi:hypothetical protein NDU88_004165 [Pleurodeles waltl]|uniref:Uncharacterized protein n=1 Tax=Pleurodeles waltl TaxID=8319 RepID=A0AAV7LKW5_PLEWA|nr:hypothetical protein NDU88_004165 [Pleurodeles waltl]